MAAFGVALATAVVAVPGQPADAATLPTGPDVSKWQHPNGAAISWDRVAAAGHSFAIVKATEGTTYINPYFATDVAAARGQNLIVGAYHYARPALPMSSAAAQAQAFITTVGPVATTSTLPPILDLEDSGGLSAGDLVTWTQSFLETVRSLTGRTPMLYSYPSFWPDRMGNTPGLTRYPLWLAHYTTGQPRLIGGWPSYTLWQYTSSGRINGINGDVDLSRFNGTAAQLAAFADGTVPTAWPITAPQSPTQVTAAPGVRSATVSWVPGDDGGQLPSSYAITVNPGGQVVTVKGTTSSAQIPNLTIGTSYTFTVTASNSAGGSAPSAVSNTAVPGDGPGVPTGLTAQVSDAGVTLTWTPGTGLTPTAYRIYRCTPLPCTPTSSSLLTSVVASTTSYLDSSAVPGVPYAYTVAASNRYGTSALPAPVTVNGSVGVPGQPTGLAGTGDGSEGATVTLTWNAPADSGGSPITGYLVGVDGGSPIEVSDTTYTTLGLSAGPHTFAVQAVNDAGAGKPATIVAPVFPTTLTVTRSASALTGGQNLTLTVKLVRSDTGDPVPGARVTVDMRAALGPARSPLRLTTAADGTATAIVRPAVNTTFVSSYAGANGLRATTYTAKVSVHPKVTAALSAPTGKVGKRVYLSGQVNPCYAKRVVSRQMFVNGTWTTLATGRVDAKGKVRFAVLPTAVGSKRYRLLLAATPSYLLGASPVQVLRVR